MSDFILLLLQVIGTLLALGAFIAEGRTNPFDYLYPIACSLWALAWYRRGK